MHFFLDIHSHLDYCPPNVRRIRNLLIGEYPAPQEKGDAGYSVGIHPWYPPHDLEMAFEKLLVAARDVRVLMIGETGPDRLCALPEEEQRTIFLRHLDLADTVHKPLIVHCIGRFEWLAKWLKHTKPKIPVIIHGFNNHVNVIEQMDRSHECYYSFGKPTLFEGSNAHKAIMYLPVERIFFETDDTDVDIVEIYQKASEIKGVCLEDLAQSCESRFRNFYYKTN